MQKINDALKMKTRAIALVKRKIDEVPSRRELQQYGKQFVELYEQMALRFTETKQYFTSYNTLEDTKSLLQKEVKILESINETYPKALKSKGAKQKFLESMDNIVTSVEQNIEKAKQKLEEEKKKRNDFDSKYQSLIEKERGYYKAAKDFQEECVKTEKLGQKLEELEKV